MERIKTTDARKQFSNIVKSVIAGEEFVITCRGEEVAMLSPVEGRHLLGSTKTIGVKPPSRKGELQKDPSSCQGFTLVELSIVLVIIGLLIGGILVGQGLIQSAKITKLITEIQGYNSAIVQFKSKYKYWPGDYPQQSFGNNPSVTTQLSYGDGNGNILWSYPGGGGIISPEGVNVWWHLQGAGMLPTKLSHATTAIHHNTANSYIPGDSAPNLNYNKKTVLVFGSASNSHVVPKPSTWPLNTPALLIAGKINSNYSHYDGILKPIDTLALDQKTDDGVWYTGNVIASDSLTSVGDRHCLNGTKYNFAYEEEENGCRLVIKLGNY